MKILVTESQLKHIEYTTLGTLGILEEEEQGEPRIIYYGKPDGYTGTPEDHKMIQKMKNIYKYLYKGRGKVRLNYTGDYPPLDLSYKLPPLNEASIMITYHRRRRGYDKEIEYAFGLTTKPTYTFHNFDMQSEVDKRRLMKVKSESYNIGYELSFVYKNKFEKFGISISY